jgi:hypothetical protein
MFEDVTSPARICWPVTKLPYFNNMKDIVCINVLNFSSACKGMGK